MCIRDSCKECGINYAKQKLEDRRVWNKSKCKKTEVDVYKRQVLIFPRTINSKELTRINLFQVGLLLLGVLRSWLRTLFTFFTKHHLIL